MSESDETDDGSGTGTGNVTSSTRDNPPFSPAKGGPTHFSDIPVKDLVIVGFMLLPTVGGLAPTVLAGGRPTLHLFDIVPGIGMTFEVEPSVLEWTPNVALPSLGEVDYGSCVSSSQGCIAPALR